NEVVNPDIKVIMALLNTLDRDPNINVRLGSLDALVEYVGNPVVREGLINSITKQDSPLVQVALADIMIALQEKRSVPELKKLLEKRDLNETAKERLEQSIKILL
ncbi:MAG: HEAT repeat domain-containing protein, partial [Bacteroidales bacterium]|nr:HEAT repeat domain-containing protein [Bacteroidales bacterium]